MMKKDPIKIAHAYVARGFSLVELMVALLIGLIISIGVVQIFGATRATYQLDEGLARAQENGRFALEFLTQDIRHAGYMGCYRPTNLPDTRPFNFLASTVAAPVAAPWKLDFLGVTASEFVGTGIGSSYFTPPTLTNASAGWSPALNPLFVAPPGFASPSALLGTDVIAIQRMSAETWPLVTPFITPASVFINPTLAGRVNPLDVLMVTDCKQAAVFMATNINTATGQIDHAAPGNRCVDWLAGGLPGGPVGACTDLFTNPGPSTTLGRMETVVFFVALTADPVNPQPTLFRNVINPANGGLGAQALVEGVENFQVLYGVDAAPPFDGTPDSYVAANNVADFARVVSVQIGILVYGVNAVGTANDTEPDTVTQVVARTSITPPTSGADRHKKRRAFNTTIQLRNRGS